MNDDFWDDLLAHIRQRVLVPVVGPHATRVRIDDVDQSFSSLIGRRLARRWNLTVPPGPTSMDDAVAAFVRERGQDEIERLYRVINDIIVEVDPEPGDALRNLAAIDDLRLFVSTTPDRVLAKAVNSVRYQGRPSAREISFSPNQSTNEQSRNAQPAAATDTVVVNLYGQAASTPQFAIHEEDRLEWLHALLSEKASLPDWVSFQLKEHPLLFIGCEIPDWLGRFLLRMSSSTRLSLERIPFFLAGCSASREPTLSSFFTTYCRKTLVQQLDIEPAEFVDELHARWLRQTTTRQRDAVGSADSSLPDAPTIFISYMREDADAARRVCDAITNLGGDVWFDERRISPGDAWEHEVLSRIRRSVRLFVPIISANTEHADEGYVFREWYEAADRARSIPSRRFIVPVIIDDNYDNDPSHYRQVPDSFGRLHFGSAPGGEPDAGLIAMLQDEIRAMRRAAA
ncbi:toll/interleukin-1 receptor domain-containing protein [Nocardia asteroides]|nr:toll/interleukin-1 receptor domain-containing protein [Nocardia asteroides]UGT51209.1 toll/interleukin-1 receptor domain-containing protein [Nocardia asteroides]